jgi:NADH oxidase (H2O2-forming)
MKHIIIGAGDAGAMAALWVRRSDEQADLDIFTKNEELGCPPCEMPLVLSRSVQRWEELYRGLRKSSFYEKRGMNLHLCTEVREILPKEKLVIAGGDTYPYDRLILALGSDPIIPPIPGLDGIREFTLSTDIGSAKRLDEAISENTSCAIVGGGFLALEVAQALKARGYERIYMLVRRELMRSYLDPEMAQVIRRVLTENGIELIMPAVINSIKSSDGKKLIELSDRVLEADFLFFGTGMRPNVELAGRAGLEIDAGGIRVNQHLQTSDPYIYAAGDCIENWDLITGDKKSIQLATSAIRTGYIAGRNAAGGNRYRYIGSVMPFVTGVFGHQVGSVGYTERAGKGMSSVSVFVKTPKLRSVFNGKPAWYKLVAERGSRALIGAQVISQEIVSGTIDKLAIAIANRMPIDELVQVDSCYSPHVQEDQIAVPLQRLVDMMGGESG